LKGSSRPAEFAEQERLAPDPELELVSRFARLLDRFYLDPLLGLLLPGAGDLLGGALGIYPVLIAWRRKAPKVLIARMLLNLSVDLLAGSLPLIGDVWDFFFKANTRNLELLKARSRHGAVQASPRDALVLAAAVLAFLLALALPVVLLIAALQALL
jgi:hypothetical protein